MHDTESFGLKMLDKAECVSHLIQKDVLIDKEQSREAEGKIWIFADLLH